jgi:hypothetical protein
MLFVALLKAKSGSTKDKINRNKQWTPPEGIRMLGDYWLMTNDPEGITVFEADDPAPIATSYAEWSDLYDITVVPAVTMEVGMKLV